MKLPSFASFFFKRMIELGSGPWSFCIQALCHQYFSTILNSIFSIRNKKIQTLALNINNSTIVKTINVNFNTGNQQL